MTGPFIRFGTLSPARLDRLYRRVEQSQVTYDHAGSTVYPDRWPDRHPRRFHRRIGSGPAAFQAGTDALRSWAPQRGIGARIYPEGAAVAEGATVLIVLPFGPAAIVAPNRIIAIIDQPGTFGFAYGTLPGHPEIGEESFVVRQNSDGSVMATVSVDARPGKVARLGTPAVDALQRKAINGYLDALGQAVPPG